MKWFIFLGLFCISFTFLFSFFNNTKLNINGYSKYIYDYTLKDIDGKEISMSSFKGKKIIIVNVASKCGYTPQYEGLEKLHEEYGDKVSILGFPSNDFLWQEPGKNSSIKEFCQTNYGVSFPLFEKAVVKKNKKQHEIYTWLSHEKLNGWNDKAPSWNFCKYLINEEGQLVNFLTSSVKPFDEEIISFIENE